MIQVNEVLKSHSIKPHWMFALDNLVRSAIHCAITVLSPGQANQVLMLTNYVWKANGSVILTYTSFTFMVKKIVILYLFFYRAWNPTWSSWCRWAVGCGCGWGWRKGRGGGGEHFWCLHYKLHQVCPCSPWLSPFQTLPSTPGEPTGHQGRESKVRNVFFFCAWYVM